MIIIDAGKRDPWQTLSLSGDLPTAAEGNDFMNNIKQITNFDLGGASEVTRTIRKGGDIGETLDYTYKVITSAMLGSDDIFKFGYCTNDNQGMNYPIFLVLNNNETEFQIGKTGMFEFQPEEYKIVDGENEKRTAKVSLSSVLVPTNVPFCIDYCYLV